jgi:hypothetical protein
MNELEDRARPELLARIPESLFKGRIHPREAAVKADDAEQVRRDIEDLLELTLRAAALGHVSADAVHDLLVRLRTDVPLDPPNRAIGADESILEPEQLLPVDDIGEAFLRPLEVVRVEELGVRSSH